VGVGARETAIDPETPVSAEFNVSAAATVWSPTVFNVTAKDPIPYVNVKLPGRSAAGSLLVTWMVPE
jgi:hypothetical protein